MAETTTNKIVRTDAARSMVEAIKQKVVKPATTSALGMVKVGNGLTISSDGTLATNIDLTLFKVVTSLPTSGIDSNKIYLVHSAKTETENVYTEYIYIPAGVDTGATGKWEKLGEYKADVDLSGYAPLNRLEEVERQVDITGMTFKGYDNSTLAGIVSNIASGLHTYLGSRDALQDLVETTGGNIVDAITNMQDSLTYMSATEATALVNSVFA